jgi:dTDP-4-dehydrorhamnose reductase
MLGQDLVAMLAGRGEHVLGIDKDDVDLTDPAATVGVADGYDVVVSCAAFTAVDAAQEQEGLAFAVNAVAAANVARASRAAGARLVQISTDYVFAGDATAPYPEDAPVAPRSAYGRTKAAGEWAVRAENPDHLVVRTAWLYGANGPSFPRTIARVLRERGGVDVVTDQVGQPTWTVDLADLVLRLVVAQAPAGTYHGTSSGRGSWFELAQEVAVALGMAEDVVRPTTSDAYVRPAPRPAFSVLGHDALQAVGVDPIGDWRGRWRAAAPTLLA